MDNQKTLFLIVGVLVAGLLIGSSPDTSNNKLVYLSSQGYSDNSKTDVYLYNLAIC